ncbi:transglutaminase-like domain-containing protein [Paenibacillus gorillae]|uniref:transglutaminase-like domain-containing protein n=1 Tax=Paenibacillus gorillae TaxID=1243662 RepID=UPI0004B03085|nr:transglutaminase-like domain-containing protein [Paenibacillus gorillae]
MGANYDNRQAEQSLRYRLLTTLLLFGLLAEWMIPWVDNSEWGAIYQLGPLLVIIGCVLGAGLFRPTWYMSLIFNGGLCIMSLMWLFKSGDETALQWLSHFPGLLWEDIRLMMEYGLWTMSGELRTLLLFVGWALLAPALQALMWLRQLSLGFAAATALYLLTLHVWLGMDVTPGLLRTTAEGLLLGALVATSRAQRIHGGVRERGLRSGTGWLGASIFVVAICVGAGLLLSGGKPTYQEPAAWTASLASRLEQAIISLGSGGSSAVLQASTDNAGITGYGFDDRELGGPLVQDDKVVFTGLSPVRAYWRGEAKSSYDGRGWSDTWSRKTLLPVDEAGDNSEASGATGSTESSNVRNGETELGKSVSQTVMLATPGQGLPLFAAGASGHVQHLEAADPRRKLNTYVRNEATGALFAPSDTAKVEKYTVQSRLLITDEAILSKTGKYSFGSEASADDSELEIYLQLPNTLPGRVSALAAEIAGGGVTSRLDQVKAIETYLENNYTYSLDTKAPPSGADLVDQFLFEQQSGYCVHFSSSMVILLRTQGIPARWVKGFTSGSPVYEDATGITTYEVRGKDAHAWVEVYFPEAGWVPFDPTPGFSSSGSGPVVASVSGGALGAESNGASVTTAGGVSSSAAGSGSMTDKTAAAAMTSRADGLLAAARQGAAAVAESARNAAQTIADAAPAAQAALASIALALVCAAFAVLQRHRLQLALAMRRYNTAYARMSSGRPGLGAAASEAVGAVAAEYGRVRALIEGGTAAEQARIVIPPAQASQPATEESAARAPLADSEPLRAAGTVTDKSVQQAPAATAEQAAPERTAAASVSQAALERTQKRFTAVSAATWKLLQRRMSVRTPHQTAREYGAAARAALPPARAAALERFIAWDDEARFGQQTDWIAPPPKELATAIQALRARK